MAKSETVPSIIVHSGSGNANGGVSNNDMEQRQTNRLSRLAKQEEFDLEENYSPSPVTIHIEDGGSGTEENCDANCTWAEADILDAEDSDRELSPTIPNSSSANGTDYLSDGKVDKVSRSHTQSKSCNKSLGKQGSSQGSVDESSPTLSRDSSTDTYTDSTGIDLQLFMIETLHKSQKDRIMLLKIEQEMVTLVKDNKCQSYKFPHMSSYNRMLVHRVAAFFGLDHNVDKNGTSVIVNKTKNTRLPDIRFKEQIRDELVPDEPKKLILKRDSASFEDGKEGATQNGGKNFSVLSKSDSEAKEMLMPNSGARPAVTKASSFGGISVLSRENGKSSQKLIKAESFNATPTCTSSTKEAVVVTSEVPVVTNSTTSPVDMNGQLPVTSVPDLSPVPLLSPPPPPAPSLAQSSEQPRPVQSPVQQVSSQQTSCEAVGKDVSKNALNGKSPSLWQAPTVESLPTGSVIINPSSNKVAPYFSPENVMYRNKNVATPQQAFMVTPLQSFAPSPQLPMPLDSPTSNPSPSSVQQHSPISGYHATSALVYIPCVTSQQVQTQPLSMHQHNPTQQAQGALEQRILNQSGNSAIDLTTQMSSLNLLPQVVGASSIQQQPVELAKIPTSQSYAYSAMKVPSYMNQASAVHPPQQLQFPVYYVQQMPVGSQNVRYYCPSGPMMTTQNVDLKKQEMIGEQRAQQMAQHISGQQQQQQLLPPGYSLLTFAQNVDNLMPYFSYAVPSQPDHMSAYLSHNMMQGGSVVPPLPNTTQQQQQQASSHLTNYHSQQHYMSYPSYRAHTPPTTPSCNPLLNYAFYAPQPGQQQQQSGQFAPSFVANNYQVIRPNIPAMKNTTPPPPSPGIIPNHFPAPPPPQQPHGKGHFLFHHLGKDNDPNFMDSQILNAGACSNSHDQKCPRIPSIHLGPPPVRVPTSLPMYRHGLSLVQDVRLLGHPLHHPLLLPQQRPPLCRYTHPHSAFAQVNLSQQQQRAPKLRRQRSKGSGAMANRNSISGGNHFLEVNGIPEGMKRSDIERYLEVVTHHGAKIQFHNMDGSVAQGGDFIVNSCRYRVVAVFETETAAQSALVNIKTAKFQLRSTHLGGGYTKSIS